MATKVKPKWEVTVTFVGDAPADGSRILRDLTMLISYDRSWGRIKGRVSYFYGMKAREGEDIYPVLIETCRKVKGKETRDYRTLRVKVEIHNREWRTMTTEGGMTVRYAVAV